MKLNSSLPQMLDKLYESLQKPVDVKYLPLQTHFAIEQKDVITTSKFSNFILVSGECDFFFAKYVFIPH